MKKLSDFIIQDKETQCHIKWDIECKHGMYEMYGISEEGILFERDIDDPQRILRHVSDGVKLIDDYTQEDCFFRKEDRKDGNKFFASYYHYEDFTYLFDQNLSKHRIVDTLKRYIYLHMPLLCNTTMLGWDSDGNSILSDPNWCDAFIQLDNKKDYTIIKRKDTVKLFEGQVNKFYFDDKDELAVVKFKLNEDIYTSALELFSLRGKIIRGMTRKNEILLLKKFIELKEKIESLI